MRNQVITIFGGSGFVGRHVVRCLAAEGARIVVAVRDPEAALFLKPMGSVGQITAVRADVQHPKSVARAIDGADTVINLAAVLYESGHQTFDGIHVRGATNVAAAAAAAGASRFVQMSAIGADLESESDYGRTRAQGEQAVREIIPAATIVRPSIIFGPEDDFFNRFGKMLRISPALPLIDGGATRFQPVYVGDVATAITTIVKDPATAGELYELGGPRVYSFKQLMEIVLRETGRRRLLIPVPAALATINAAIMQLLPKPPLTIDQIRMLAYDNVVDEDALSLADLGLSATPLDGVLPTYMYRYRRGGGRVTPRYG